MWTRGAADLWSDSKIDTLSIEEELLRAHLYALEGDPLIEVTLALNDSDSKVTTNSFLRYAEPGVDISTWAIY